MTQRVEVSGRDNLVIQIQGDGNTIVQGFAYLKLTRYLNLANRGQIRSEAHLLNPYVRAIPLVGREAQLGELRRWMTSGSPMAIRVLTGRAGSGKTRLALELCDIAAAEGWDAGFVIDYKLPGATWGWQHATLVVLDDAATHAQVLRAWFVELANNPGAPHKPLRILLLERHADPARGWWKQVFGGGGWEADIVRDLLDPPNGPIILAGFTGPEERRQILDAISEKAKGTVNPPVCGIDPTLDQQLAALSWGDEPLFLMMAGLLATRLDVGRVLALARTELAFRIADNEIDRIQKIADDRREYRFSQLYGGV